MTAAPQSLVDPSGRPIQARDIARIRARADIGGVNYPTSPFAYDAAVPVNQEMASWLPWLRSPDTEINIDRDRMVARVRDLIRNDGWAKGAVTRILDAAIGAHFFPVFKPNWRALARRFGSGFDAQWAADFAATAHSEWRLYADDPQRYCDAQRRLTVTQMLYQGMRHKLIDGDAFGMVMWAPERVGAGAATFATTLQMIDPDRVSNPYQQLDTHAMRGGVQIDDLGAPVGYHIRRAHQNDWYDAVRSMAWDYFPRYLPWGRPVVLHDFDADRTGQHRGIGILTEVLARFKMLHKFDAVSLQAAVLRTIVGFFLKSPYDESQIREAMDTEYGDDIRLSWYQGFRDALHKERPVVVGGVRVPLLAPGESIETVAAGEHATDFEGFQQAFLRGISANTGQAAEEITNDFSKLNYSSFRGAMLQAWKTLIRRRKSFATGFATPFCCAWLEEAMDMGLLPMPAGAPEFREAAAAFGQMDWIGPGRGWVDPVKERQGEVLGLDAGFGTLSQTCAEVSGAHWIDTIDEREIEEREMKKRGLHLPDWAGGDTAFQVSRKPKPE